MFVKNLVNLMNKEDLELQNQNHNTALCLAAASGNVEIAKILVEKNEALLNITGRQGMMPLHIAALSRKHHMVRYLYDNSRNMHGGVWTNESRGCVLLACIEADLFDVALEIVEHSGELVISRSVLDALARKPDASFHVSHLSLRLLVKQRSFHDAVIRKPDTFFFVRFHRLVLHRNEGIYNIIHEIGSIKDSILTLEDKNGNNILHLVAEGAKNNRLERIPGVVLQMQYELLWFKEIEASIPHSYRAKKNKDGLTPHELFSKNHKALVSQGEEWMKGTAAQLMVVATLIATIAFEAAFTIPGGYKQDTGTPIFQQRDMFTTFIILDAISFITSSISILIVLSILTSPYAERDFLEALPKKLLLCVATLFTSIATLVLAFVINFFLLYQNRPKTMPIVIIVLSAYTYFEFFLDLLIYLILAMTRSRSLFNKKQRILTRKI